MVRKGGRGGFADRREHMNTSRGGLVKASDDRQPSMS